VSNKPAFGWCPDFFSAFSAYFYVLCVYIAFTVEFNAEKTEVRRER
jgi:hypothetical protein